MEINDQETFDRQSNLILPRVFDRETSEYYYPVFSELGITYESKNNVTHDDIKNLNEVFKWHFCHEEGKDSYMKLKYDLDLCTGICDKNGNMIYENDAVSFSGKTYIVRFSEVYLTLCFEDKNNSYSGYVFKNKSDSLEVIGDTRKLKITK